MSYDSWGSCTAWEQGEMLWGNRVSGVMGICVDDLAYCESIYILRNLLAFKSGSVDFSGVGKTSPFLLSTKQDDVDASKQQFPSPESLLSELLQEMIFCWSTLSGLIRTTCLASSFNFYKVWGYLTGFWCLTAHIARNPFFSTTAKKNAEL